MFPIHHRPDSCSREGRWSLPVGWLCRLSALFVIVGGLVAAVADPAVAYDLLNLPGGTKAQSDKDAYATPVSSEVTVDQGREHANLSWSGPGDIFGMNLDLAYAADDGNPLPIHNELPGDEAALARQFLSLTGKIQFSDLVNLSFSQKVDDRSSHTAEFVGIDNVDNSASHDLDRLTTTDVSLGLANNRLRLTRRVSWSSFNASRFDFGDPSGGDPGSVAQSLSSGDDTGFAVLERADATLWRSANLSLSVFGLRNTVNQFYETFDDGKKKKKEDPLEVPNRVTLKYGIKADLGPFALNMAQFTYDPLDAGEAAPSHEQGHEAKLSLNVADLRGRANINTNETLWSIAPTSLWVKYSESLVDVSTDVVSPDDFKSEVSFGGTWGWNNAYGSLSYWYSTYDSRQIGANEADWSGEGIDVSTGYSRDFWGVDATLSLGSYHNYGTWNQTAERSYDGTIGGWLNFKNLPDLKASLSLGRYATDDLLYEADNFSDYLKLGLAVDFTKYLPKLENGASRSMKLFYGLDHSLTQVESSPSQKPLNDHTVFLRYSTNL